MFWNWFSKKETINSEDNNNNTNNDTNNDVNNEDSNDVNNEDIIKDSNIVSFDKFKEDEVMYDYIKNKEDFDYIFNFIKDNYKKKHFNKILITYSNYIDDEHNTIVNKDIINDDIIYSMNNIVVILDSLESNKLEKYILNILYFVLDKYDGCGWRKLFEILIKVIINNEMDIDLTNIVQNITTYGRFDSLYVFMGSKYENIVIDLFVDLLKIDYDNLLTNNINEISTICKWLPKENSIINKKHKILQKISRKLIPKIDNIYWNQYVYNKNIKRKNDSIYLKIFRKEIVSIIRTKLKIRDNKYNVNNMNNNKNNNKNNDKNINIYNLENDKYVEILNFYKDADI